MVADRQFDLMCMHNMISRMHWFLSSEGFVRVVRQALFAALISLVPSVAGAAWPDRSVTLIVPFAPGGITDVLARMTAERLQAAFKQPFVIENVTGAAGVTATQRAARANPDGYTLYFATLSQISISPFTHKLDLDPMKAFKPISIIATTPFVVTVRETFPANSLKEFIDKVKSQPGQFNFASAGVGTLTHLSSAIVLKNAGLDMVHVPYRGVAPAFAALLANQVDMLSASPVELRPHMSAGKLKFLGVTSPQRTKSFPDVPAVAEVLPKAAAVVTWNALLAPAGTPQDIIDALSREIMAAEKSPEFREKLESIGVDPVVHTPEEFAKIIAQDTELWRDIIEALGVKAQ
jgi:tripartite-type tricarboxylate transporter receptor subunit TctC